jgi:TolB-like protein
VLAGLLALALCAPLKVAVMPLASGEGVPGKTAEALTESVTAEVRRRSGAQVITQSEVTALLSLEQQKAMLGCQNDACFAEIGGALGVERVVSGQLSRLGESWLFHLQLIDAAKASVLTHSDRRLRGGTIDDVLDTLPAMVGELFPPAARPAEPSASAGPAQPGGAAGPAVTPAVVKVPGTVSPGPPPGDQPELLPPPTAPMPGRTPARAVLPAFLERSIPVPLRARGDLQVFTDGAGHFLALAPFGAQDSPVFYGDRKKLFLQQVIERHERDTTGYGVTVWDPRVPGGAALVAMRGEDAVIRCGHRELPMQALPRKQRTALLLAATYYAPPFVRQPVALARDDEGNFFFVDSARDPGPRGPDYRLYAGPQGALARQEIEDIGKDGAAVVLRTARGRLRVAREGGRGTKIDWLSEGGRRMLIWMDPAENQQLVFGDLGVYGSQPLGTPCDAALGAR